MGVHPSTDGVEDRRSVGATGGAGVPLRRRHFLTATGAGAALGLAGCLGGDDDDVVTLGAPYILSGFAAMYGEEAEYGVELAVDQINEEGGIDGQEVEVILRDTEADPDTGIRQARSLVEEDDVDALFGLDSSAVGLAVAPVMEELQVPIVITHAATPFITAPAGVHDRAAGNEYVFRISNHLGQNVHGAAVVAGDLDATRWTNVGPDYAFGHDTWEYFVAYTEGMDLGLEYVEDGVTFPELASDDYTPHIERILSAEPEAVLSSLWGTDLVTFVDQAEDAGFFEEVDHFLASVGMGTELPTEELALPEGEWASSRYWPFAPDSPENQEFRETYWDEYERLPTYNAEGAYRALWLYKDVIEEAGTTETDALLETLHGYEHTGPVGEYTISEETGQAILPSIWGVTEYSDEWGTHVLEPVHRVDAPPDELASLLDHTDLPAGV